MGDTVCSHNQKETKRNHKEQNQPTNQQTQVKVKGKANMNVANALGSVILARGKCGGRTIIRPVVASLGRHQRQMAPLSTSLREELSRKVRRRRLAMFRELIGTCDYVSFYRSIQKESSRVYH